MQGVVTPAQHNQTIHEPEAAQKKSRFISCNAIIRFFQVISQHEAFNDQFTFDGFYGSEHTPVRRGQEADKRNEQQTRIQSS